MNFIDELALRRRFGMKPGLDAIRRLCRTVGEPQKRFRAIHVAGTNGKGAVCALIDAALQGYGREIGVVGRYTSPHLVKLNERFFIDGKPISDERLEFFAKVVHDATEALAPENLDVTFFEALTAVAFLAFADAGVKHAVLECGLGGRLDATNVCDSEICVITRVGLDHCDWLGDTVEKIAAEKAGIVKPGVPVVLGCNSDVVRMVISKRAEELGSPFFYAPDVASDRDIPDSFSLGGLFNRENAVTAMAALRIMSQAGMIGGRKHEPDFSYFARAIWPGRFQRVGEFLIDGAHNPPAAEALAASLRAEFGDRRLPLVAGFCGDKDVDAGLRTLAPCVSRGFAVKTCNPRSLPATETAARMRKAGMSAEPCDSLLDALARSRIGLSPENALGGHAEHETPSLVCGSLFLAGEALTMLGGYPWGDASRMDPSEQLGKSA